MLTSFFNKLLSARKRNRKQRRRPLKPLLRLEQLEARIAPAIINGPTDPTNEIRIQGDHDSEIITINDTGTHIEVIIQNLETNEQTNAAFAKEPGTFDFFSAPERIHVRAASGDDLIINNTNLPMWADGGDGNDTIHGGDGNDTLIGNMGSDLLFGHGGNDILYGDLEIRFPGDEREGIGDADTLYGGAGVDVLWGAGGDDVLYGEDGNDFLYGGWGNDILDGGHGHDKLSGGLGNDTLYGGAGNDELHGEEGDDFLYGHEGNDELHGGDGNDYLHGGDGDDELHGGDGEDELHGGRGADTLDGGPGNDTIYGGLIGDDTDGDDVIFGSGGDDLIYGSGGNDTIFGGFGNDTIFGDGGNDIIWGDDGDDVLHGGHGDDVLHGGSGADQLNGDYGSDTLYGGPGNDVLRGGLFLEPDGDDVLYGEEGDDTLAGFAGDDRLYGGPGEDILMGMDGDDQLFGGPDDDTLLGGAGNDLLKDSALGNNILDGGPGINQIILTFGMGLLHAEILDENGEHVLTDDEDLPDSGDFLSLAGTDENFPDSGFTLEADAGWTRHEVSLSENTVRYEYRADGFVFLHTAVDLLPLPIALSGMTIRTQPIAIAEDGLTERRAVVDPDSLSFGFDIDAWITNNLSDDLGIDAIFPSLTAEIKSGGELRQIDPSYPLRENQPYLYAQYDTSTQVKFGDITIAPAFSSTTTVTLIVDPTDPFVYFKSDNAAVGMSLNGRAQFHPSVELVDYTDVIYGHIAFRFEGMPLPGGFSLNGDGVIDFDANDDGVILNGAAGPRAWFDRDVFLNQVDDIRLGVNGELRVGPDFKNSFFEFLDISVKVGEGTIVFDGDQKGIHFRGKTTNPFANTPLEDWAILRRELDISGSLTNLDSANPQFRFDAFFKDNVTNQSVEFHADNNGAVVFGTMEIYGQRAFARGTITSDGRINIFAYAHADGSIKLGPATFETGVTFDLTINGNLRHPSLTISGSVDAYANVFDGDGKYGLAGKVNAELDAGLSGAGSAWVRAEVSGSLTLKLDFIEYTFEVSAAAQISNEGLQIRVNNTWHKIVWSSSQVFSTLDEGSNESVVTPGGETTDTTPTLEWNEVEDAVRYELWVNNVTTGQSQVIHRTDLTGLSFEQSAPLPFGQYRVWTRPHFANNEAGSWSAPYDFHIVPMLTPKFAPFNRETTDATPEIPWYSVPDATRYELWVDNLSTGQSRVIHQTNLTELTHTPGSDLPDGNYRAWVRAAMSCLRQQRHRLSVMPHVISLWRKAMPLYMDVHKHVEGLTAEAVADAHKKDLETQDKHGVKYHRYWFNEKDGTVFCLVEAPSKEAAEAVHREAHGLVADELVEVQEGT